MNEIYFLPIRLLWIEMVRSASELEFYRDELTDREFYLKLARKSHEKEFSDDLERLASVEETHSRFWADLARKKGLNPDKVRARRLKVRGMSFLSSVLGKGLTIKLMEYGEVSSVEKYRDYLASTEKDSLLATQVQEILTDEIEHESVFQKRITESEVNIQRNQDVIYGVSDSLIEVLAAMAGLSAIIYNGLLIALGGILVALGGTISMSVGAYLAKISESEYKLVTLKKKALFDGTTEQETEAEKIRMEGRESAYNVGLFYFLGAWVPILPFIFLPPYFALLLAVVLVALTEAIVNSMVAISLGVSARKLAVRAALLSVIAAMATYALGLAFHNFLHISVF